MKIELDDIRLAHSPLTDTIFAGVLDMRKSTNITWRCKTDVTNDFITAVIARWENQTQTISLEDNQWEITVKKIK